MKTRKITLNSIAGQLSAPDARFYAFVVFFVIVFFTGGGSRDDIQSLLILRPIAVLFCAYALTVKAPEQWKGRQFPLYIAGALLALMVLQLIPLPPSVWTGLPGRQIFADIANIAGIEQPWRPLTLSPSKTLNSLFSLAVPIAAIMLYLNLDREYRKRAISVIILLAAISVLLSAMQLAGSPRGPLYLYNITNDGAAVGLFANRNHQSVFLAVTIVMLAWYAALCTPASRFATLKIYGSISGIFVVVPLIFVAGSRAGLILMAPALIAAFLLIYFGRYSTETLPIAKRSKSKQKKRLGLRRLSVIGGIIALVALVSLSIYSSRSIAFGRLFGDNELGELRVELFSILIRIWGDYFPWGAGFGSFEHVYRIYEPQEMLSPYYLNQAHNDWLQFPIEGGVAAILIAAVALVWLLFRLRLLQKKWNSSRHNKYTAIMAVLVMLFFLAGSVVDYPLRVPSLIAVFGVMSCCFNDALISVQRKVIKSTK